MSIRALHYITGDTQQSGFRRIGQSPDFPADDLPLLNNGPMSENARVATGTGKRQNNAGVTQLCHVYEYQTGKYGIPVVINDIVAIGTGRAHGFSEYVVGIDGGKRTVAEYATPGQIMNCADDPQKWLTTERFMAIPGREELECEDEQWDIGTREAERCSEGVDEYWKQILLSHYWKQASVRAFSEDQASTVRVNLGEFDEFNKDHDIELTIEHAKLFFADVIAGSLPKQVQNIASMAAGVDCLDHADLYTALEFDIKQNMFAEETLLLKDTRQVQAYKLNEAEQAFIAATVRGEVPALVTAFFEKYKKLANEPDASVLDTPFMADYRFWYDLYCMERILKEGHDFIISAHLNKENDKEDINDAKVCFNLMRHFRRVLSDHATKKNTDDYDRNPLTSLPLRQLPEEIIGSLVEETETALYSFMLDAMRGYNKEVFMARRTDMLDFQRHLLKEAPDQQLPILYELASLDQRASKAPQFIRCYPSIAIRNEEEDRRNAEELSILLRDVVRPLIDAETGNEKIQNKYLLLLREEDFADKWALLGRSTQTKEAVRNFLWEEIRDNPQKHFLLYGISRVYIDEAELLCHTLKLFAQYNSKRTDRPSARQLDIASHPDTEGHRGNHDLIAKNENQECVHLLNEWYAACYSNYRADISQLKDIVVRFGGNTTEVLATIFDSASTGTRMTAEEVQAVFETFGGKDNRYAVSDTVKEKYINMINAQRESALNEPSKQDNYRKTVTNWICDMVKAAPFEVDTTGSIYAIFKDATINSRIDVTTVRTVFDQLGGKDNCYAVSDEVKEQYIDMINAQRDNVLNDSANKDEHRESIANWISDMVEAAPFKVDTAESMCAIFKDATTNSRLESMTARTVFDKLSSYAENKDEKVRTVFNNMVDVQLGNALQAKDEQAVDWVCGMVSASEGQIRLDTSDSLKQIFKSACEGPRMRPSDAEMAFMKLSAKATEQDTSVRRTYSDMLSVRRKEAEQQKDTEAFNWLIAMTDRSPYKDPEWIAEQHTANVCMLSNAVTAADSVIETQDLKTIRNWLEAGTVEDSALNRLQKYCEYALGKSHTEAADVLEPYFDRIDDSCTEYRKRILERTETDFQNKLTGDYSLAQALAESRPSLEKARYSLDVLYDQYHEEVEKYIQDTMEHTSNLQKLIDEQEQIPAGTKFLTTWRNALGDKIYSKQTVLFNQEANLNNILELKEKILSRSNNLEPSLKAAYELINLYEEDLDSLTNMGEYQAVSGLENMADGLQELLTRAEPVRKNLCNALAAQQFPTLDELKKKSFRHALCGIILQTVATGGISKTQTGGSETNSLNGMDWSHVLKNLFSANELTQAGKAPFKKDNLRVLQRLLATVENVRLMDINGLNADWVKELINTINTDEIIHKYLTAVRRNTKECRKYDLTFDDNGLVFALKQNKKTIETETESEW